MRGAEAVLRRIPVLGLPCVEKFRVEKKYRVRALDDSVRRSRTRREARLLSRAKQAGVRCPVVYQVGDFFIRMGFLGGRMLYRQLRKKRISGREISGAAGILAKLHSADIVHGDYTPANLMLCAGGMAVIDFGLGSISTDSEDKATDIVMMKKALGKDGERFVSAYSEKGGKAGVVRMVSEIEKRARYMERG